MNTEKNLGSQTLFQAVGEFKTHNVLKVTIVTEKSVQIGSTPHPNCLT